jgi:hypothetical protein
MFCFCFLIRFLLPATSRGQVEVALLLLEKGADVVAKNHSGKTPLDTADSDETAATINAQRIAANLRAQLIAQEKVDDFVQEQYPHEAAFASLCSIFAPDHNTKRPHITGASKGPSDQKLASLIQQQSEQQLAAMETFRKENGNTRETLALITQFNAKQEAAVAALQRDSEASKAALAALEKKQSKHRAYLQRLRQNFNESQGIVDESISEDSMEEDTTDEESVCSDAEEESEERAEGQEQVNEEQLHVIAEEDQEAVAEEEDEATAISPKFSMVDKEQQAVAASVSDVDSSAVTKKSNKVASGYNGLSLTALRDELNESFGSGINILRDELAEKSESSISALREELTKKNASGVSTLRYELTKKQETALATLDKKWADMYESSMKQPRAESIAKPEAADTTTARSISAGTDDDLVILKDIEGKLDEKFLLSMTELRNELTKTCQEGMDTLDAKFAKNQDKIQAIVDEQNQNQQESVSSLRYDSLFWYCP